MAITLWQWLGPWKVPITGEADQCPFRHSCCMSKVVGVGGAGRCLRHGINSLSLHLRWCSDFFLFFYFLTMKNVMFYLRFFTFCRISLAMICVPQFIQLNSCSITLPTITRVVFIGMSMLSGRQVMLFCCSPRLSLRLCSVHWNDLGLQEVWVSKWWSRLCTGNGEVRC